MGVITSNDRDIDRNALHPKITTSKDGPDKTSVGSVAHLVDLVAAVELRVTACRLGLLHSVVASNSTAVYSTVAGVLAVVSDLLVAFAVVAGGRDLAGHEGGRGNCEGKSENGEDGLDEHVDGLSVVCGAVGGNGCE